MKTHPLLILILSLFFTSSFSQIPNNIPQNGLIGFWGFNGNANDASGNNHNGTATNVISTTDRFGNSNSAYLFNGKDSRINTDDTFFDNGWSNFTISCWANSSNMNNANNVNDSQIIFNTIPHNGIALTGYGNNQPFNSAWNNKYVLLVGSNPELRDWDVVSENSNSNRIINNWNHYVLIKSGLNYSLYINGILDKTFVGKKAPLSYLCKITFGNISPEIDADEGFNGKLDDFAIWNRALTNTEINNLFKSELQKTDLSLKAKSKNQITEKDTEGTISFTLKNEGKSTATNIKVFLRIPYTPPFVIKNSQNCSKGTFDSNMWNVPELAPGDSCVLNIAYQPIQNGVWYIEGEVFSADQEDTDSKFNNAIDTEDDFARACMSIPIKVTSDTFGMQLMIEDAKMIIKQWYKDGSPIAGATQSILQVTSVGKYSYQPEGFICPTQGCCPFILEKATVTPNCCVPLEYILKN